MDFPALESKGFDVLVSGCYLYTDLLSPVGERAGLNTLAGFCKLRSASAAKPTADIEHPTRVN